MNSAKLFGLFSMLVVTACAGGGLSQKAYQADHKPPQPREIDDDAQRGLMSDALTHLDRADQARTSGNLEQARAEWKSAADAMANFAEKFPTSEWHIVARRHAAEKYLQADDAENAAKQAEALRTDPLANEVTKAQAARISALAYQVLAFADVKAGKLEPLRIKGTAERKGEPKPTALPEQWKRFVTAADLYIDNAKHDPDIAPQVGPPLALLAGQAHFVYDNVEEARKRFEQVINNWPSSAEAVDAANLYLATYSIRKEDTAQIPAAVEKLQNVVHPLVGPAQEAAKAGNATPEMKKKAENLAKLDEQLGRQKESSGYYEAQKLLDIGKAAEAGAAFEKFADGNKTHPDAPNALYNAGVAWEKANDPKKAMAVRERLIKEHPDAKIVPQAILALASAQSKKNKDHAGAAKHYAYYLEKWPTGDHHCLAQQNLAYEYDEMKKKEEAAKNYRAFGTDDKCVKEDPNSAAKALYRAGSLYSTTHKNGDAKEAWSAMSKLGGVTDAVAKSQLEDAKKKLKGMK